MWGIEFKEASNALICGSATFEARFRELRRYKKIYRVLFNPHNGMTIQLRRNFDEWQTVIERATPADLEAILPKEADFGHDWTYSDFMIAMTFFDEGYKRGLNRGRYDS